MLYQLYVAGRDSLGLVFKRHRTHAAFTEASRNGLLAAWKQACSDNIGVGNPHLPSFIKAAIEVMGVLMIAFYGLKRWRFVAATATLLLAQTASEQSGGGGGGDEISDLEAESDRLGELFDNIADQTNLPPDFMWPDCDCKVCHGGCDSPSALPSGGLCTNCTMDFHH